MAPIRYVGLSKMLDHRFQLRLESNAQAISQFSTNLPIYASTTSACGHSNRLLHFFRSTPAHLLRRRFHLLKRRFHRPRVPWGTIHFQHKTLAPTNQATTKKTFQDQATGLVPASLEHAWSAVIITGKPRPPSKPPGANGLTDSKPRVRRP